MARNPLYCGLFLLLAASLSGCGGSEADTVADNTAAPGGAEMALPEAGMGMPGDPGYGGGQAGYGGGQAGYGGGQAGYGGGQAGYGGGQPGFGEAGMLPDSGIGGEAGYGMGMAGMPGGYAGMPGGYGGMAGYAGGMPGGMPGHNGNDNFNMAIQFVRQNCVTCHGPQQSQGDLRLDGLTNNFTSTKNASTWHAVMRQLQQNAMPPAKVQRRPDPRQQQTLVSWIQSSLSNSGFVPLEQQSYLARAKHAFSQGDEQQAMNFLYAHVLAADESESQDILARTRWYEVGLRPATTVRFAVGVILDAPSTLKDIKPLGAKQFQGGGGGGGSAAGFGGNYGGEGTEENTERSFHELTGTFGEALVTAFESRWSAGDLGTVFNEAMLEEPEDDAGGALGYGGGFGGPGGYGGAGLPGGYAGDAFEAGMGGGGFGDASGQPRQMEGAILTPGLHFLGTGSQTELLQKAVELGVDGLFVFDVKANPNRRTGMVNNDTRLRIMGTDGKALAATSTLSNTEIERAELRGVSDDALQKNIDRIFAQFDEKVRLKEMPVLTAKIAHARLRQLLVDTQSSKLYKLFETRLYHSLGLLTQDELAKVYQIVLQGNEGLALANGSPDDRKLVLKEVLPN
ncbi:MAG: hypothetical protein KDA45_00015 [Planctomycetales bacterium]|nr:hypothetical protein [Planctomycetales bacterium]